MANVKKADSLYVKMLAIIMVNTVVSKNSLSSMCSSERYMQKLLKQAESMRHIKTKTIERRFGNTRRKEDICSLTAKGFRYLLSVNALPWMEEISLRRCPFKLFPFNIKLESFRRMAYISCASVMSWAAGAEIQTPLFTTESILTEIAEDAASNENDADMDKAFDDFIDGADLWPDSLPAVNVDDDYLWLVEDNAEGYTEHAADESDEYYDDSDGGDNHDDSEYSHGLYDEQESSEAGPSRSGLCLTEFLTDVARSCGEVEGYEGLGLVRNERGTFSDEQIVFTDSIRMKYAIARSKGIHEIQDYRRCEFTGVLDSRFKSVLVYTSKLDGMSWSRWVRDADIGAHNLWRIAHAIADRETLYRNQQTGMILVKNAMYFADLFFDGAGRRGKSDNFGYGFEKLYAVPISYEGSNYINWIMSTDDREVEADIISMAVNESGYTMATDGRTDIFPLEDANGVKFAVGVYMDFVKIKKMLAVMEHKLNQKYGIMCMSWQKDYYRRIFSNVKYVSW